MKKYLGYTILSIAGAAVIAGILISFSVENTTAQNPVSSIVVENLPAEYEYVLRDYNGYLAVFVPQQEEPQMVFEVFIRNLPPYDQQALQTGIGAKDYSELLARIEDFIS